MCRLDEVATATSAQAAWSRSVRTLKELKLIGSRRRRNLVDYYLLDESGDGSRYSRPKVESDGTWFTLPYAYWTGEHDKLLSFSEKRMLLIALAQQDGFALPAARAPQWYGVSETSAQEGFSGLMRKAILADSVSWEPSAKSPTRWRQVTHYTLMMEYARSRRTSAITRVAFPAAEPAEEAVDV